MEVIDRSSAFKGDYGVIIMVFSQQVNIVAYLSSRKHIFEAVC